MRKVKIVSLDPQDAYYPVRELFEGFVMESIDENDLGKVKVIDPKQEKEFRKRRRNIAEYKYLLHGEKFVSVFELMEEE